MATSDETTKNTQPAWVVQRDCDQKKTNIESGDCPYHSSQGQCTVDGRTDWLLSHGYSIDDPNIPTSLEANLDQTKPLYYWQLHSIMGPALIEKVVSQFYTRVYNDDENPEFRDAFKSLNSLEHNISKNTFFWIDVFGGGKMYLAGEYSVQFHHKQPLAKEQMNAQGASRWLYHMGEVLCATDCSSIDVRIKPCLIDFVKTKMMKYAREHKWEFDIRDFDFVKRDPEMIRLYESKIANLSFDLLQKSSYEDLMEFLEFHQVQVPPQLYMEETSLCSLLCGGGGYSDTKMKELVELAKDTFKLKLESQLESTVPNMTDEELKLFLKQRGLLDETSDIRSKDAMIAQAQEFIQDLLKVYHDGAAVVPCASGGSSGGGSTKLSSVRPEGV